MNTNIMPSSLRKLAPSYLLPNVLLQLDKWYSRTPFPRGRAAFFRLFCWGTKSLGFQTPVLRLDSGIVIEYSPNAVGDVLIRELVTKGAFEVAQTELMRKQIPEGGVFLDVGANIGYFSILAAKWVGKNGRVFAFEPASATNRLLCKNISLNGVTDIVTPVKLACFSSCGEMPMKQDQDSAKSHLSPSGGASTEMVGVITIDEFAAQQKLQRVDFLKIHAEGPDIEVLLGAREVVKKFRPVIILETDHCSRFGQEGSTVESFFAGLHYSLSKVGFDHSSDMLFLPEERSATS